MKKTVDFVDFRALDKMTMKIFADMHHGALSYSLHLLFEKRLGWELYFPIGLDWRKEGYWQYSQLKDTVKQYLGFTSEYKTYFDHSEHFDKDFEWRRKHLTFDQFKKTDIDVILCSVGPHEDTFFDLIQREKPKAKMIRQIGNWNEETDFNKSKNLMISVGPFLCPDFVNYICYHQEFDLKQWKYRKPTNFNRISTYINCFPDSVDFPLWEIYKKALPEFDFKMHGHHGDDGNVSPQRAVRESMADSGFIWHIKLGGEGFGHVIHGAYALGRPVITKGSYYRGKMAEPLLIDNETCIDLEKGSVEENVKKIKFWSKPEHFKKMSRHAFARFQQVCDYDKEEKEIRKFLGRLK